MTILNRRRNVYEVAHSLSGVQVWKSPAITSDTSRKPQILNADIVLCPAVQSLITSPTAMVESNGSRLLYAPTDAPHFGQK